MLSTDSTDIFKEQLKSINKHYLFILKLKTIRVWIIYVYSDGLFNKQHTIHYKYIILSSYLCINIYLQEKKIKSEFITGFINALRSK